MLNQGVEYAASSLADGLQHIRIVISPDTEGVNRVWSVLLGRGGEKMQDRAWIALTLHCVQNGAFLCYSNCRQAV